jgi:uncharacterized protein
VTEAATTDPEGGPDKAGGAPLRLRPPKHQVSRRAIPYWTVRAATGWVVALGILIVITVSASPRPSWLPVTLGVVTVLALVHLIVMPRWRYAVHRWETTNEAVYTQSGWLRQERRIAPVTRIQTVDTDRGIFERLFGLSNLTVTTASAHGPLKIDGLDRNRANELAAELTSFTAASREDAT